MARALLTGLHALCPSHLRALLSLLVRLLHASAKGEDLGAHGAHTLGRFGAAGARILKGAHRARLTPGGGPGGGGVGEEGEAGAGVGEGGGGTAPQPARVGTPEEQEAALMDAVAAIPIGPMPLFKCLLVMETLHATVTRAGVLASLFQCYEGGGGRRRRRRRRRPPRGPRLCGAPLCRPSRRRRGKGPRGPRVGERERHGGA